MIELVHRYASKYLRRSVLHGLLLVGVCAALSPFGWALASASGGGPQPWSAFVAVVQAVPLDRYLLNSLMVAGLTAAGQIFTAASAGYVFARLDFRGRDTLFLLFLSTLIIPEHVTMLPTLILLRSLNWLDSYAGLIVPNLVHPFSVFLCRQYFITIPTELEEAAMLDGGSRMDVLWRVMLPLSQPVLVTVGLFSFLWSWNSFLWPLIVLQTPERYTLPIGLSLLRTEIGTDWPIVMAAALIAALPVATVFLLAQRWLWGSVTLGQYEG